jgi:hypothetical protein
MIIAASVVLAPVAGCAKDDDPASAAATTETTGATPIEAPPGYSVFADSAGEFSVALPEEWRVFDLSDEGLPDLSQTLAEAEGDPVLTQALVLAYASASQGGRLYAVDSAAAGSFSTSLSIVRTAAAPGGESNGDSGSAPDRLPALPGDAPLGSLETGEVDLPSGRSVSTVTYVQEVTLADGRPISVHGTEFLFPGDDADWVLTFRTDRPDDYAEVFETVAGTFVWT